MVSSRASGYFSSHAVRAAVFLLFVLCLIVKSNFAAPVIVDLGQRRSTNLWSGPDFAGERRLIARARCLVARLPAWSMTLKSSDRMPIG